MQLIMFLIGLIIIVIAAITIIKSRFKNNFSDDYEIDFEERHKRNFISRFKTDYFDFRNHID